jgi:cytochrome P450
VLGGRPPEYADLASLPYTRMVVDEAMRLYPPAWGFSRQALGDDQVSGYHLPRGWMAFVVPYVLHRLPSLWEEPEAFDPDRFAPMHRQPVRADRSAVDRGHAGAALPPASAGGPPGRGLAAHHAAPAFWHADVHRRSRMT